MITHVPCHRALVAPTAAWTWPAWDFACVIPPRWRCQRDVALRESDGGGDAAFFSWTPSKSRVRPGAHDLVTTNGTSFAWLF